MQPSRRLLAVGRLHMRISIFGMGYVGTVSAVGLAEFRHDVIRVDADPHKVDMVNRGLWPVVEEGLDEAGSAAAKAGRLRAIAEPEVAVRQTEVSLISVGTPKSRNGTPLHDAPDTVVGDIGVALRHKNGDHTVVPRSTARAGVTGGRVLPRLLIANLRNALDGGGIIVIGHASRDDVAVIGAKPCRRPIFNFQGIPGLARLPGLRYRSLC